MNSKKLCEIQKTLKAPKGNFNKFGNYHYRSCEDICEAAKPILAKLGVALVLNDEIVQVGDRIYVKATATLMDEEGQISVTAYAREEENKKGMDASQVTGATSSYARKYALNGLFCIDDTKDADTMDNREEAQKVPAKKTVAKKTAPQEEDPDPKWADDIRKFCIKNMITLESFCGWFGVENVYAMTKDRIDYFYENKDQLISIMNGGK